MKTNHPNKALAILTPFMKLSQITVMIIATLCHDHARASDALVFSDRTKAAIAQWNKLNPEAPATTEHINAIQSFENATGNLMVATMTLEPENVASNKPSDTTIASKLSSIREHALAASEAMRRVSLELKLALKRTRHSRATQDDILKYTSEGYRVVEAWIANAIQAADAGLTARELLNRELPSSAAVDSFRQHWKSLLETQDAMLNRAKATQKMTDSIK